MKKLFVVALAAALMLGSAGALASLERKEDRFSGATTWSAKSDLAERHSEYMWVPDSVQLTAVANRDGSTRASLLIMTSNGTGGRSQGWRYLGVDRVLWLADGQPLEFAPAKPVRNAQRGFVVETFIQPVTPGELQAIADARLVEFKIGSNEFRLPAAIQQAAREALVHLQAESASAQDQGADDAQ